MTFVVDSNVPQVADGLAPQVGDSCRSECIDCLKEIVDNGRFVLDSGGHILSEYASDFEWRQYPPGPGQEFLRHVYVNQRNPERMDIVETGDEWPADLAAFHAKDRPFTLASKHHRENAPVLEAADTDWWFLRDSLRRHGVKIDFVCEEDIGRLAEAKSRWNA